MPKAINYKANSIIYFKGDISDKIFILNEGKISLNSIDIETGVDIHELIKTGEFFGVKSSLGRYPREETAVVISDSKVIAFTIPEFEQMVSGNTRVIVKMLQVFSNQLRRIHKQVQNLMLVEENVNPETGLYKIGQYYLKAKKYKQAIYAFDRYLLFYPSSKNSDNASQNIAIAKSNLNQYGQGQGPDVNLQDSGHVRSTPQPVKAALTDEAKTFYSAISLMSKDQYEEASNLFKDIISRETESEYSLKSKFEIGKCLFYLKKYDNSIKVFSALLQKYPKHPDFNDALKFIAKSNELSGDKPKAVSIYRKLLSMIAPADPMFTEVNSSLKNLERSLK